jgi:DNA-directed RNA polymerase sigma subunit (sigma70/sigma32)
MRHEARSLFMNAGRSYREVAKALGLTIPKVQSIEFQALKKCRTALLRDCPDDFADARSIALASPALPNKPEPTK